MANLIFRLTREPHFTLIPTTLAKYLPSSNDWFSRGFLRSAATSFSHSFQIFVEKTEWILNFPLIKRINRAHFNTWFFQGCLYFDLFLNRCGQSYLFLFRLRRDWFKLQLIAAKGFLSRVGDRQDIKLAQHFAVFFILLRVNCRKACTRRGKNIFLCRGRR